MKKLAFLLLTAFCLTQVACGGRTPSTSHTASIAKKYFTKYGKKYRDTDFAGRIATVEVKEVRELQKNVATSFVLLKMENGTEIPVIMTVIKKMPTGWRTTSWELATQ